MERMTFGRHAGDPCCDVPLDYLIWVASNVPDVPKCVVTELRRRSDNHGSRDAVKATAAISGLMFRSATKKNRKAASRRWRKSARRRLREGQQ